MLNTVREKDSMAEVLDLGSRLNTKSGRTREQVLVAALACYDQYGIGNTTLELVAEKSGLSRATVYRYARNRRELVNQVFFRDAQLAIEKLNREVRFQGEFADFVIECFAFLMVRRDQAAMQILMDEQDDDLMRDQSMPPDMLRQFARSILAEPYAAAEQLGQIPERMTLDILCDWVGRLMRSLLINPPDMVEDQNMFREYLQVVVAPVLQK